MSYGIALIAWLAIAFAVMAFVGRRFRELTKRDDDRMTSSALPTPRVDALVAAHWAALNGKLQRPMSPEHYEFMQKYEALARQLEREATELRAPLAALVEIADCAWDIRYQCKEMDAARAALARCRPPTRNPHNAEGD